MKHQIIIHVTRDDNSTKALKAAEMSLPDRIIRWLFGDFRQVYLLAPGESIDSVHIKEMD